MIRLSPRPVMKSLLGHALWPAVTRFVSEKTLGGNAGLIYTFHYVGSPVIANVCGDLFLPRGTFARVLDFISHRLAPLEPAEFLERLEAGSLPPRATMLTFDDCTRDAYTKALPELEERGLKACFFACPRLIDQRRTIPCLELMDICARAPFGSYELKLEVRTARHTEPVTLSLTIRNEATRKEAYHQLWPSVYRSVSDHHTGLFQAMRAQMAVPEGLPHTYPLASWEELDQMYRRGMWIANHTMAHSTCFADPHPQFAGDVADAYNILDRRFPSPRRLFCYPYGAGSDVSPQTSGILTGLKTDAAFLTQGGAARPARDGMLKLRREDATYSVGAAKLAPLLALTR